MEIRALGFCSASGRNEAKPRFRPEVLQIEPRHAPILVVISPPVQYALSFLAGVVLDRLMPWRPAWMTMEGVHWVGAALAVVGFILAVASAGGFVLRGTTLTLLATTAISSDNPADRT